MRKIFLLLLGSVFMSYAMSLNAQTNSQRESDSVDQDSTVDVVAYFSKNDTAIYWITQSSWRLSPTDSVETASVSTKVRLTVVDSTSTSYKMNYTVLEVRGDSTLYSSSDIYQTTLSRLVEKMSKRIVGTTIVFETDELGEITKFNNLGQIKHQAKSLFQDVMNDLLKMPEIVELKKEYNIDFKGLVKNVDSD